MYAMDWAVQIGNYRLQLIESITVSKSVEKLADTATIVLPASIYNKALEIEDKVKVGDRAVIQFGYDAHLQELPVEFEGYVESITSDNGGLTINCEDELYNFRKDVADRVLQGVTVKQLMEAILVQLGGFELSCDYDFKYDQFTIYQATAFDVLKKVQEETKANIYLKGNTLHIHPQYTQIGRKVIHDFAVNIEKSDLKYKAAQDRKVLVTIEGTDAKGKTIKVSKGTPGGDKINLKIPGVSDQAAMEARLEQELKIRAYTGYEGNFTAWLIPYVEPTDVAEIRDADYEHKTGSYYVVSVESTFSGQGGSRKITVGRKIEA